MIVLPQLVVSSIAELWINSILFYFIFILSAIYISFLYISVNSFRIQNVHRGEIVELFFFPNSDRHAIIIFTYP